MTLAVLSILDILEIPRFFRLLVFLAALICFHSILFLIILILFTIHDFSASYCQEAKNFLGFHASKRDTTE